MNTELLIILGGIAVFGVFLVVVFTVMHRRGGKLNREFYKKRWNEIQELSKNKTGWVQAIIEADKLLDDALKKSGYKGKTMGERLVSASRAFSDKDRTWAAHKLRNKVVHETSIKLRAKHVHGAVRAFHSSLKDLGAL